MSTKNRFLLGLSLLACALSVLFWFSDSDNRSGGGGGTPPSGVSELGLLEGNPGVPGLPPGGAGGTAPSRGFESASLDGDAPARRMPVEVDSALGDPNLFREGDRLSLPAPAGRSLHGVVDSISRPAGVRTVLRGRIDADPLGHFVISIAPDGRQVASIHLDRENTEYFVRYDPARDQHVLSVLDLSSLPEEAPCEACTRTAAGDTTEFHAPRATWDYEGSTETLDTESSSLTPIDVMVVYTPAAANWANDHDDGIHEVILDAMAKAQLAMDNSEGLVEFRLVHTAPVDYVESGDAVVDLRRLTETEDEWAAYLDEVHQWRDEYAADLVALFVEGVDYGGIAWIPPTWGGDQGSGFSITRARQAGGVAYTHAHEMGHNLGLAHDIENAGDAPGVFDYSYGWRWEGTDGTLYRSVMAYPPGIRVPHFSNPDVLFPGTEVPTGDALDADNARTIREMRHVIAAYRDTGEGLLADRAALTALYEATGGENWSQKTGWLDPETPVSEWYGVTVSGGRVTEVNLPYNNLVGTLPAELGGMGRLEVLRLYVNQLTGPIPPEFGNLYSLRTLRLEANQLSGAIPSEIGAMVSMINLWLDENNFTGALPPELGNLAFLQTLFVNGNGLSGSLPQSLTQLELMNYFWFHDTDLCEPQDQTFQVWLGSIDNLQSSGIVCPEPPSPGAVALELTGSVAPLQTGKERVLSASLKDANGDPVTSGADSELMVEFRKAAGEGSVGGLGVVAAVNGVAALTITGSSATGPVLLEAVAFGSDGEPMADELGFDVVSLTVALEETVEVGSLSYEDGEIDIAAGGLLTIEVLEVVDGGTLLITGEGILRVETLLIGRDAWIVTNGSVEVTGALVLSPGGVFDVAGRLVIGGEAEGEVWYAGVDAGSLEISTGGELSVYHGGLTLGGDGLVSQIAGRLTFFHSLGSIEWNGDLVINGHVFGLISDVHAAEGVLVTVASGGEMIMDGCVVDAPGLGFALEIDGGGAFTLVRSLFENGLIAVDSGLVTIRDNLFVDAGIEIAAGGDGAAVFHNVADNVAAFLTVASGVEPVTEVDGWGNVESRNQTINELMLEWRVEGIGPGRTLDGEGNLFVQPGDSIEAVVELDALSDAIGGASILVGYAADYFPGAGLVPGEDWLAEENFVFEESPWGRINASLDYTLAWGFAEKGELATVALTAAPLEGRTVLFLRWPQPIDLAGGFSGITLSEAGAGDSLTPFTVNSGYLTIDGTPPQIASGIVVEQDQDGWRDMVNPGEVVEQGVLFVSFAAYDALAGIEAAGVSATLHGQGQLAGESIAGALLTSGETVLIEGTWHTRYVFEVPITEQTPNGVYTVWAQASDRSGNLETVSAGEITVNKNEIDLNIALQGFTAGTDANPMLVEVRFAFTDQWGTLLEERVAPVVLGSANLDTFTFRQVPEGTAYLSAKAPKHLRRRLSANLDANGQATVDFTGSNRLLGGDLTGNNRIRGPDLAILSEYWFQSVDTNQDAAQADITGDGRVRAGDLAILQTNWFLEGDPR